LHDLRRTVATGLQKLGVRLEVTEQVLNHVSGSRAGIVGVCQRHDFAAEKRRHKAHFVASDDAAGLEYAAKKFVAFARQVARGCKELLGDKGAAQ
jgi:hypothetical protein